MTYPLHPSAVWFNRLIPLLKDRKLPCEYSPARVASVDEFMFMQEINGAGQFKHRDTRNYVIVRPVRTPGGYELYVPCTTETYHRGFFDQFNYGQS